LASILAALKGELMQPSMSAPRGPSRWWSLAGNRALWCLSAVGLLALLALAYSGAFGPFRDGAFAGAEPRDKPVAAKSIILLTGFEPFGEKRPPNPSWEGIKDLDGKEWMGHQLVCKRLRVVWGSPLEQVQEAIDRYHPVAIFSFGQGRKGTFTIESKASNERRRARDNRDDFPATPTIIADGPKQFAATSNCEKVADLLAKKGYPIRVSTNAGQYLCEETLYTLEYLKSKGKIESTVMFCHVPPLGSSLGEREVTAEYVHQFVQDVLACWQAAGRPTSGDGGTGGDAADDPRREEVRELIVRYFRTWSEQDITGYDACFYSEACVQYLDGRGRLSTSSRNQFIASQREYHRSSTVRTVEVPETIDIRFEEQLARVVVHWKLTQGARTERGLDHFTLRKVDGSWRIVNLVFYTSPK
jgi:pyroglutamyl-peptidase